MRLHETICGTIDNEMADYDFTTPLKDEELLLQGFYKQVKTRGKDVYLVQPGYPGKGEVTEYTFEDVYDQAARMAAHLKSQNFPPSSKIAIVSKNCAHFFMCEMAIWMSGHVTVALFPNLNVSTTEFIMGHAKPEAVFVGKTEPSWDEMKKGIPDSIPLIAMPMAPEGNGEKWDEITSKIDPIASVESAPVRGIDDESIIVYTSGSTGVPKGVLHSFRTITEPSLGIIGMHKLTNKDRYLSYLPIAHVMDRFLGLCTSMLTGMKIYFAESLETFVADMNRCRPTVFISVPRLWLKFQQGVFKKMPEKKLKKLLRIPIISYLVKRKLLKGLGLDACRISGSGSAPIPSELLEWYRSLGLVLCEGYGMSENFCYSHSSRVGKCRAGYIGHPFPGVECKLSDEDEILVKSPGTMIGYYLAPDKTAEVMTEDGFLRTGDKGFIDTDGNLKITGRIKELFKTSKGKYVAPVPIENMLNADSNIEMSLVGGSGQVATMAVVQLGEAVKRDDPEVRKKVTSDLEVLLKKINNEVEEYERVAFIAVAKSQWTIEDELLTPTMKVKRASVEALYEDKLEGWYESKTKVIWED